MPETNEPLPPELEQPLQRRRPRLGDQGEVWMPANASAETALTSAVFVPGATTDEITIYVFGDAAGKLEVPVGVGPQLLADLNLERVL